MTRRKYPLDKFPPVYRAKWPGRSLDEGFVPFPKRLLRGVHRLFNGDKGLEELSVLLTIIDYQRISPERGPSEEYLAFQSGLSGEQLARHLEILSKKGWLKLTGPSVAMEIDYSGFLKELEAKTDD
jgi:hypothetical protein